MTDKEFLELYDTDRDKLEEIVGNIESYLELEEWFGEHIIERIIDEDVEWKNYGNYGKFIYLIGGRYFSVNFYKGIAFTSINRFKEVRKKTYFKRIEVTEWLSMLD